MMENLINLGTPSWGGLLLTLLWRIAVDVAVDDLVVATGATIADGAATGADIADTAEVVVVGFDVRRYIICNSLRFFFSFYDRTCILCFTRNSCYKRF